MSDGSFLYFFPGVKIDEVTREWLRKSPIAEPMRDIWERAEGFRLLHKTPVNNGPAGSGIMLAAISREDSPQAVGYYKDHQRWVDCGGYWLGIDNRYPPSAVSLERRKVVPGIDTELAAGGVWCLPIIRQPDDAGQPLRTNLPLVRLGGTSLKMPERYQQIWELTGKLFAWWEWNTPLAETKAESAVFIFNAAATCLGVNYRVGPREVGMLECLEADDELAVVLTSIDVDSVETIRRERNRGNSENPTEAPG